MFTTAKPDTAALGRKTSTNSVDVAVDQRMVAIAPADSGIVLSAPRRAIVAGPAPGRAMLARTATILDAARGLLTTALSPLLAPRPATPAQSPVLLAVLGWVRREIEHTYFNRTPVVSDQQVNVHIPTPSAVPFDAADADNSGRTFTVPERGQEGGPSNGTVTIDQATDKFTYHPDAGVTLEDTDEFEVTLSDAADGFHFHGLLGSLRPNGGHTDTATITVRLVNEAPVAVADSFSTLEDEALVAAVLANDDDADNDALTPVIVSQGTKGKADVNLDGTITYTPYANENGADVFTYRVSDGVESSDTVTVNITITAVDDAPTVQDRTYDAGVGEEIEIDLLSLVSDPDSASLNFPTIAFDTTPGLLTFNFDGVIILGYIEIANDSARIYAPPGTYTDLRTFTYTAFNSGTDTITYTVTDGTSTRTGTIIINATDPT